MPNVKLISNDDETFTVDIEIAKYFTIIEPSLELCYPDDEYVPVLNLDFKANILRKIIEWVTHHEDDLATNEDTDDIGSWDADFLKLDKETLFELTVTAKCLGVNELYKVASKILANMIGSTSKAPEEVRRTPEEEEQICQEMEGPEDKSTVDK